MINNIDAGRSLNMRKIGASKEKNTLLQGHTKTSENAANPSSAPRADQLQISADANTSQALNYTQRLTQGMRNGTGNGNPNAAGSPLQVLNAQLFNVSIAFGNITRQSGTENVALQSAFRDKVLSLFDDAVMSKHIGIDDTDKLEQLRTEARALGNAFLNNFFSGMRGLNTPEMLQNTGMSIGELAFHNAWNITYFEVGMTVLGGSDVKLGSPQHFGLDGNPIVFQTDEEFRRLTMEMLLNNAIADAEVFRQRAEMIAEEARRWEQMMEIFRRMMRGENVSQSDQALLAQVSPGLLMVAMLAKQESESEPPVS